MLCVPAEETGWEPAIIRRGRRSQIAPRRGRWVFPGELAPVPTERVKLTDQVTRHDEDDGLFRTPGQADERSGASDATNVKPLMQPSRDLFHHTVQEARGRQRPTTQRDEAAMRSLRFPFDEDD